MFQLLQYSNCRHACIVWAIKRYNRSTGFVAGLFGHSHSKCIMGGGWKIGVKEGRDDRILTPNELHLTFWVPNYGVKFHQNQTRTAAVSHRQTDLWQWFLPVRRYATATCLSVCLSVCPSVTAGIVSSRAKAGSWNVHHLIAPWFHFLTRYMTRRKIHKASPPRNLPNEEWGRFFRRHISPYVIYDIYDMSPYLENGAF